MGNAITAPKAPNTDPENPQIHNHDQPPTILTVNEQVVDQQVNQESSTFTCEICIEPLSSNKRFNNQNKCVHPFCTDCIIKYIQVKVVEDSTANVECPGLNCNLLLDPLSCKPLIPPKTFDKWSDNLCESFILGHNKCYCPYQNCSTMILNECGVVKGSSTCPKCKNLFCFNCNIPWHAGYRCDESAHLRDRNDVLFGQLLERWKWTRCPGCGHSIERITGCRIITCRCKTSFCYYCGKKCGYFHKCPVDQPSMLPQDLDARFRYITFVILFLLVFGVFIFLYYIVVHIQQVTRNAMRKPLGQQPDVPNSTEQV